MAVGIVATAGGADAVAFSWAGLSAGNSGTASSSTNSKPSTAIKGASGFGEFCAAGGAARDSGSLPCNTWPRSSSSAASLRSSEGRPDRSSAGLSLTGGAATSRSSSVSSGISSSATPSAGADRARCAASNSLEKSKSGTSSTSSARTGMAVSSTTSSSTGRSSSSQEGRSGVGDWFMVTCGSCHDVEWRNRERDRT